jgi:hypothetical protein
MVSVNILLMENTNGFIAVTTDFHLLLIGAKSKRDSLLYSQNLMCWCTFP